MNKTAIKNFAVWARNKLIADITYKAGLMGITEAEIKSALPQSTKDVEFYDIGTREPYSITGEAVRQRRRLAELINQKAESSDYNTAYRSVMEEVAYTWFNRLIAIRFMEVNDYLPSRIRVLSSESKGKLEPDLVTTPFEADLDLNEREQSEIIRLKTDNQVDDLFRILFVKQCNALNKILPKLFEKTSDYTELLLNVSVTDRDGVVYHLVHDIDEDDFNISKISEDGTPTGQVEIIGWLYQYYNTEPKDEAFALLKKNVKITKERIPAVTQLFTPDWIVRYMVENSLGRLWLEHLDAINGGADYPYDCPRGYVNPLILKQKKDLRGKWKYYLDEAKQTPEVEAQLVQIWGEYKDIKPEDIKIIDPCMGSGHILVYAFEVLMQIYAASGYTQPEAAKSILENNLYGLDIDDRAFQMAYFAVMMKARQYNRRILNGETDCHVYAIQESNNVNRNHLKYFGKGISDRENIEAENQLTVLLDTFVDAKEYGSILNVNTSDWNLLRRFLEGSSEDEQMSLASYGVEDSKEHLQLLIETGQILEQKYDVVVTNPPYMGKGMSQKLNKYLKRNYDSSKGDLYSTFIVRSLQLAKMNAFVSMITQHSWMFLSSYEKLRIELRANSLINMLHLGTRAFEEIGGAVVQTTAFVYSKTVISGYASRFVRLLEYQSQYEKENAFLSKEASLSVNMCLDKLDVIEGKPLAYWTPDAFLHAFTMEKLYSYTISDGQNKTGDNNTYLREHWEVCNENIGIGRKWLHYAKGGSYRKWYGNLYEIINWSEQAREHYHEDSSCRILQEHLWYRKGITWGIIAQVSFRMLPEDATFDMQGSSVFVENEDDFKCIIAYLNSVVAYELLNIFNTTLSFQIRDIRNLPYYSDAIVLRKDTINSLASDNIKLSKQDWDSFETSWDFVRHPLVCGVRTIAEAYSCWQEMCEERFTSLKANEEELNRIFIDIYDLQDELIDKVEDKDVTIRKANLGRDIRSLISYAVGCMFGIQRAMC